MAGWTTTGELSTNTASGETVSTDPTALQSQSPTCTQGQVILVNFYSWLQLIKSVDVWYLRSQNFLLVREYQIKEC